VINQERAERKIQQFEEFMAILEKLSQMFIDKKAVIW